jgi:hypothetical protein
MESHKKPVRAISKPIRPNAYSVEVNLFEDEPGPMREGTVFPLRFP